ncbi:MAG: hypothetical protein CL779_03140 [Chloroflexi bacterium]|nr:hypothetical protein [Chloroflexota bacterium]
MLQFAAVAVPVLLLRVLDLIMDKLLIDVIVVVCMTCFICCVVGQIFIFCMDKKEKNDKKNKVQPI